MGKSAKYIIVLAKSSENKPLCDVMFIKVLKAQNVTHKDFHNLMNNETEKFED